MALQFNFANLNVNLSQTSHAKYAELTSFVKDLMALPERKSQIMMSPSWLALRRVLLSLGLLSRTNTSSVCCCSERAHTPVTI